MASREGMGAVGAQEFFSIHNMVSAHTKSRRKV